MRRIAALLFLLAAIALPASAQTTTSACSAMSLGDMGALNGWIPSPNDAWHQDISTSPLDPNSNKIITTPGDLGNRFLHPDFSNVVDGAAGIPYTVVDSAAIPLVRVTPDDSDDSDNTLFPLPINVPIEGSPGQCWSDGADHHVVVIDRATCSAYEIYQANLCNGQWTSYANTVWDFTVADGEKRPYGMTSVDAAGLSVFEGLIRYDEIVAGQINHAIRFTATHTKDNGALGYFTAPAVHAAGNLWGTDNIMGMRIRLKAGFDISSFSSTNQIILNAMKKYGMILADNGGDLFFQGTPDPRWNDDDLSALKSVPNTAFEVVQMGTVYDQNTAPKGSAPHINSFTASLTTVVTGSPVVLAPAVSNASYEYIDNVGLVRGPVTVYPTHDTTYTLWTRNAYGTSTASVTVSVTSSTGTALSFSNVSNQVYGNPPFTVNAVSNSPGSITYSVVSGPATLSGNTVSVTGAGTITLQAKQAASGSYAAASALTSFNVTFPATNLTFAPIPTQAFGASPFAVSASSNSPAVITYSVVSGPATVSGNRVTLTGGGIVTLQASQPASGNYDATIANTSFTVNSADTVLVFAPVGSQTFPSNPFTVTATSNSAAAISYSVVTGPATVVGNLVTLTARGIVTLQASQPATAGYNAGSVKITFSASAAPTNLTFAAIPTQTFGATPFAVSATSNSTGAITYSVLSGPATILGNVVTLTGAGAVTLQAAQAAAGSYQAATASTSFSVNTASTSLVFAPLPTQTFGAAPFAVGATSNSNGAITYSVLSGPATLAGNVVTTTGAGTVTLQAGQAAAGSYQAATASTSFSVNTASTSLVFAPVPTQTFGAVPFAVSATSSSNGAITYSVLAGPATISGNIVTLTGAGTVTLQATQVAAGNYQAATATASFSISAASTSLVFAPVPTQTFGAAPFAVSATSSSTGAITYSVLSGPASILGNIVTLTGAGTVTLQAAQAAAGGYQAATATASFSVSAASTSLILAPVPTQNFGAAPFAVSATSSSNGAITYSVLSGPATLAGNIVKLTGAGTVTLQATQAAAGNYQAATATASFSVGAITPSLTFAPIGTQELGGGPITVLATSNSTATISYSVVSGPATLSGSSLLLNGAGPVTVQATQAATGGYTAAAASISFNVNPGVPTLTLASIAPQVFGSGPLTIAAHSNSPGAITYDVQSGPAVAAGNSVVLTGAGTVVLQASQAASGSFSAASVTVSFSVNAADANLTMAAIPTQTFGAGPLTLSATSASSAPITYAVLSGPAIVNGASLALDGAGSVTVQASQPASGNYLAAAATTTFSISPSSVVLSSDFAMPRNINITIPQGATGSVSVPVSAVNGFSGIVSFQCTVPANMMQGTCNTTNASLTAATSASSTVVIGTGGVQMVHNGSVSPGEAASGAAFLAMLLPCGLPLFRGRKFNLRSFTMGLLLALTLAGTTLTTTGCGSIINGLFTAPGTYVIPVKAAAGNASHAMTITVTVQPGN